MKIASKLLVIYSFGLGIFIVLSGLMNSTNPAGSLIFIPIPLYFLLSLMRGKTDGVLPKARKGYVVMGLGFLVLLGVGVYNIRTADENAGYVYKTQASPIVVGNGENQTLEVEVVVEADPVEIKQGPSEDSEEIGVVTETTSYSSVEMEDGWYKILLKNKETGWVHEDNVYEILENK